MRTFRILKLVVSLLDVKAHAQIAELIPAIQRFDPFAWKSEIPEYSLFIQSKELTEIRFLGIKSGYRYGDTSYTTWVENGTLYSPWTDGKTKRLDGYTDWSQNPPASHNGITFQKIQINQVFGSIAGLDNAYFYCPVWIFGQSGSALDTQLQRAKK